MQNAFKKQILLSLLVPVCMAIPWSHAQESPDILKQHIESARDYMSVEQWDYAAYEWRAALAQDPKNLEAHKGLAENLMNSGNPQDAVRHLEEVRSYIDKLSIELLYGQALEQSGRYDQAEKVYLNNLKRLPLEPESFSRLIALQPRLSEPEQKNLQKFLEETAAKAAKESKAALNSGNYAEAIRGYEISTTFSPNHNDLNDYGLALLLLGRYENAVEQFTLLKGAKKDIWAYYANAALALVGKGNGAAAIQTMEKAIATCNIESKKPLLYNDLGFIYEHQGKWAKAKTAYAHAVELAPNFMKAKMNLGYAYQKDMDYDNSIQTYKDILKTHPNDVNVLNRLGFVYELAHKEKQAVSIYRQAILAQPGDKESYSNLSVLYRKLGKNKLADIAYKQMMDVEFKQMEVSKNKKTTGQISEDPRKSKNRLLEFVDVFFSPSVASG